MDNIKICRKCNLPKDAEKDFNWRNKEKGYRHSTCKDCWKLYVKDHYKKNKSVYITRARERSKTLKSENTRLMLEYFRSHPCVDCGERDFHILEFDHVRGEKSFGISDALYRKFWKDILAEIENKCEVRCANCHRKRHTVENGWRMDCELVPIRND